MQPSLQTKGNLGLVCSQRPSRVEQEGGQEGRQLVKWLWAGHCRAVRCRNSWFSREDERRPRTAEARLGRTKEDLSFPTTLLLFILKAFAKHGFCDKYV